jgi:hypothetical protein
LLLEIQVLDFSQDCHQLNGNGGQSTGQKVTSETERCLPWVFSWLKDFKVCGRQVQGVLTLLAGPEPENTDITIMGWMMSSSFSHLHPLPGPPPPGCMEKALSGLHGAPSPPIGYAIPSNSRSHAPKTASSPKLFPLRSQ